MLKYKLILIVFITLITSYTYTAYTKNTNIEEDKQINIYEFQAIFQDLPKATIESIEEIAPEVKSIIVDLEVPTHINTSFKTYMSYKAITNTSSNQYKMQQNATTDELGFRKYNDKYMIALGQYYSSQVGEEFIIYFSDGGFIQAVTGDIKQNVHTDSKNQYVTHNGNIVEFIVDTSYIPSICKKMGDMSYASPNFSGHIIKIEKVLD